MLLFRSISLEIFLVIVVHQLNAQEEYGLDDSEDHSEYSEGEEHSHPDYSKYYSVDGPSASQSIPETGFIGGAEFSGFFSPQPVEFAGTKKEKILTVPPLNFVPQVQQTQSLPYFSPIHQASTGPLSAPLRDFFEESQKRQLQKQQSQLKEAALQPGPSYISHALPLLGSTFGEIKAASVDEVERIPPRPNKPKTNNEDELGETDKDFAEEDDADLLSKNEKYGLELLKNSKPYVDYNIGKSSSTVAQYPLATGLVGTTSKLTPYQKYSFQPVGQASRILDDEESTKPYNPNYQKRNEPLTNIEGQSSENVPSHLKNHDCRRLSNAGSDGMNCFICTNAETNSKYTQCSYTSDKEPVEYYTGASERFSVPAKPGHFRYRRYANKKVDPYYLIRERSRKTFDEPSIPDDYSAGFQYEPESFEESPSEISFSEQQSEELKKNPEHCQKIEKDGSVCTVCRNPKTGGNFEQCSYSSAPQEKKYAYVKEKKYDSDDDPEETKIAPKTKLAPTEDKTTVTSDIELAEASEPKVDTKSSSKDFEPVEDYEGQIQQEVKNPKKRNNEDDPLSYDTYVKNKKNSESQFIKEKYEVPKYFAESVIQESRKKPNKEEEEENDDDTSKGFDEYHFKLFPELSKEESRQEDNNEEYQVPEATKQNVEEVLAEFTKKDRSQCKKSENNGMTCFLCVDKNKIQHEECMFIQESRPQSSHIAYHELKGLKKLQNEEQPDESKNKPVLAPSSKEPEIKKDLSEITLEAAASEAVEDKVPARNEKKQQKKKRNPKKYNRKQEPEPTIKTPVEFEVGNEEGAFSAETRPVYSKIHGTNLPKYMIEKSEFEKEFDASAAAF